MATLCVFHPGNGQIETPAHRLDLAPVQWGALTKNAPFPCAVRFCDQVGRVVALELTATEAAGIVRTLEEQLKRAGK